MGLAISEKILETAERVEDGLWEIFRNIDKTSEKNTARVLKAFQNHRVSDTMFAGTSGYGYDDNGREALDGIYADVFGAEAAIVRQGFVNGTHAITAALFASVGPGETLLSVSGAPYDTLRTAIGTNGAAHGSLLFYGVKYAELALLGDGSPDIEKIKASLGGVGAVFVQRSRGYSERRAFTVEEIGQIAEAVHSVNPDINVIVDNCYGEFTELREPTYVGADLLAGSLIKNPGGGLARTGGYIAGKKLLVERAAERLTTPGIGGECGATLGENRNMIQGFFMAPHTTAQALKTAVFCAAMLEKLGFDTAPGAAEQRSDIIQTIRLGSPERVIAFCRGIQRAAPVDSFVTPEPWKMPGYDSEVIMAAGSFIQGASIELSCDAPMREPYTAFLQGGLTYESGKLGIMSAISEMLDG